MKADSLAFLLLHCCTSTDQSTETCGIFAFVSLSLSTCLQHKAFQPIREDAALSMRDTCGKRMLVPVSRFRFSRDFEQDRFHSRHLDRTSLLNSENKISVFPGDKSGDPVQAK